MAETSTFVKIDRNILKWRWYKDETTFRLFIHLIINANISDCGFEKIIVHRGQLVSSYPHLASDLGVSVKQIRTALNHLKETGEVAVSSGPKYSVITVLNYDKYQDNGQARGQAKGSLRAGEGQAKGSQGATIKEYKELKNKRIKEDISLSGDGYPDDFEIFWHEYPKKVGKKEAFKAFKRVKEPLSVLIAAVRAQEQSAMWNKENGRFIPNPATWLNQGRWDDMLPKEKNPFDFMEAMNDNTGNSTGTVIDILNL